jgi:thymidylate synthase (FAD)
MESNYQKRIQLYDDSVGAVEYVQHMGTDLTVVNSARVSFGKHKEILDANDEKLIRYLISHQHTSTLEHNQVTFRFMVPLYVAAQHMRHRTWSYNSVSRRYTEENLRFYSPNSFRTQHASNRQASNLNELTDPLLNPDDQNNPKWGEWIGPYHASQAVRDHHVASLELYEKLLATGVCREQARGVLPQNLYTEYYGSANLNNCLKFCSLRLHEGAQWEIQQVARAMVEIMRDLWPVTLNAWIENLKDENLKSKFLSLG